MGSAVGGYFIYAQVATHAWPRVTLPCWQEKRANGSKIIMQIPKE